MKHRSTRRFLFAVIGLSLFPGCAQDEVPPVVPERTYTLDEVAAELDFAPYLSNAPDSVEVQGDTNVYAFDPAGPARCLYGTPYRVSVRKGASPNVLLYFQGGGACWNEETCISKPITLDHSEALSASNEDQGVFSRAEANPFRDWNVVFAGYCDGSFWMGDADATYGARVVHHRGMANAAAAVGLLRREFPAPGKLVISGSSAGGYGTLMGYVIGRTVFPQTPMAVLNDAGPWLLNPDNGDMTEQVRANWNLWNAAAFRAPACPQCTVDLYRIADWAMGQDESTRWGIFSFERDLVIADLYLRYGERYPEVLREMLLYLERRHPRQFHAYLLQGADHVRFGSDAMYDVTRDGVKLSDWMEAMVTGREDWKSVPELTTP